MPQGPLLRATYDHVAHAASSIRSLLPIYRDLLGGEFIGGGENPRVGFRTVHLRFEGGGKIELLEPTEGSSFLDSFLAKMGDGGLHHVTYLVPDIEEAIEACRKMGIEPFGIFLEMSFWKECFLHPRSAGGALIQLAQPGFDPDEHSGPSMTLEEFLEHPRNYWAE